MLTQLLYSQFGEVSVDLDLRQIRDNDIYIIEGLEEKIISYYESTQFDQYLNDIQLTIHLQFIIESISKNGNEIVVSAQVVVSNNLDQHYYSKGIDFTYSRGKSIYFSPMFDSLSSLLDYYAFLFIANELDTFELKGGNLFFNKCQELANEGLSSTYPRGWEQRKKKIKKIKERTNLRELRYNFFVALDELDKENPDQLKIVNAMEKFYINLLFINDNYGRIITQGFIGCSASGPTTLGKEGSDYSAAILGNIFNAEKVILFKDVDGVYSADPKKDKTVKLYSKLTYDEAYELCNSGNKVIHPKTIKPLKEKNIPLIIKNINNLNKPGTIIS